MQDPWLARFFFKTKILSIYKVGCFLLNYLKTKKECFFTMVMTHKGQKTTMSSGKGKVHIFRQRSVYLFIYFYFYNYKIIFRNQNQFNITSTYMQTILLISILYKCRTYLEFERMCCAKLPTGSLKIITQVPVFFVFFFYLGLN